SHLAALLGINGACYSIVGDDSAWVEAIRTARLWLKLGEADFVLVLGAEELDPIAVEGFHRAGWFRHQAPFRPSEGATAILLSSNPNYKSLFQITGVETGWTYRNRREALESAKKLTTEFSKTSPVYRSAQRNWLKDIENEALQNFPLCADF